jgi:hypothetical protein
MEALTTTEFYGWMYDVPQAKIPPIPLKFLVCGRSEGAGPQLIGL